MYTEQIGDSEYGRIEADDWDKLNGMRVMGRGKIVAYTNAEEEHHPAVLHVDGGEDLAVHELCYVEFDGRHGFVDL